MRYSYAELAGMIDHSLLHPTMTDRELRAGCRLARKYKVASVFIKPYFVKEAVRLLRGSGVVVGTVVGFPHGSSATAIKRAETALACRDGATEIDMVVNIGKVLSADWRFVSRDIAAVVREARRHRAIVKVILENDYLPTDRIKRKVCRLAEAAGAAFVKTSTGYGFVKRADGSYGYQGATAADLAADAPCRLVARAGQGGRRGARSRRAGRRARTGRDPLRRDRDGSDADRLPRPRASRADHGGERFRSRRPTAGPAEAGHDV